MSGIPSAQLALEIENRRLRERIAGLERMLAGELAQQSALSDRERSKDGVDQSHKNLAELVERAPFGIYIVDSQFRIVHGNAASQAGVFRSVRPVIGRDLAETMRMLWPDTVAVLPSRLCAALIARRAMRRLGAPRHAVPGSGRPSSARPRRMASSDGR